MKKLKRLSLQSISKAEMEKQKQNQLKGGGPCGFGFACDGIPNCPCLYAGEKENPNDSYYGGSSTVDNGNSNGYGGSNDLDYYLSIDWVI